MHVCNILRNIYLSEKIGFSEYYLKVKNHYLGMPEWQMTLFFYLYIFSKFVNDFS